MLMRVKVIDFGDITNITPNIEGDGVYSISIYFNDGTSMVYGYTDRDGFRYDYHYLLEAWKSFGNIRG